MRSYIISNVLRSARSLSKPLTFVNLNIIRTAAQNPVPKPALQLSTKVSVYY